jgi:hypothetical protein
MTEWQTIETAPRDKIVGSLLSEEILIFVPTIGEKGSVFVARWDDDEYASRPHPRWESTHYCYKPMDARKHKPTLWMPIPFPKTESL